MGKLELGSLGVISGKVGSYVVYKTKNGKQVIREYVVPKDPKSPKQLACRKRFGTVNSRLSPLKNIIRNGYQDINDAYRKVTSKALREAVVGEYPDYRIDYSKIQIAGGKLKLPENISVKVEVNSRTAFFCWEPGDSQSAESADDRVNIVCMDESVKEALNLQNIAKRSAGTASINLISKNGTQGFTNPEKLHFWVYLTSCDFSQNSDSIYVKN